MYAVIRTGGKQYRVATNDVLEIEKLPGKAGDIVAFGEVLMLGAGGELKVGTPAVDGAHVSAEIVDQHRGDKVIIFKKRRRQNYRRRNGHRQYLTTVRILEILADNQKAKQAPTVVKAEPKADAPAAAKPAKAKKAPAAEEPAAAEKPKAAKPKAEKATDAAEKPKAAKKPAKKTGE
jgi:large subunit ribosomal protein L21